MNRAIVGSALLPFLLLVASCDGDDGGGTCVRGHGPTGTTCWETGASCDSAFRVTWGTPIAGGYHLAVELGEHRLEADCPGLAGCGLTLTCDGSGFVLADEPGAGKIGPLADLADEPLYWELRDGSGAAGGTVPSAGTDVQQRNGQGCVPTCATREWTTTAR